MGTAWDLTAPTIAKPLTTAATAWPTTTAAIGGHLQQQLKLSQLQPLLLDGLLPLQVVQVRLLELGNLQHLDHLKQLQLGHSQQLLQLGHLQQQQQLLLVNLHLQLSHVQQLQLVHSQ